MKIKEDIIKNLSEAQLEAAYRFKEFNYRVEDVMRHAENMLDDGEITETDYQRVVDEADYLAEQFLDRKDCNIAENTTFRDVILMFVG